jgi:outer membrane lipoprotein SlyB
VVCHSGLRIDLTLRPCAYRDPRSQPFFSASYWRQLANSSLATIQSARPVLLRNRARGSGVVERGERVV